MRLQNIIFPKAPICTEEELYFHSSTPKDIEICEKGVKFKYGGNIQSDTYFNSFSQEKWFKYTVADNISLVLELKGTFRVNLVNKRLYNHDIETKIIETKEVSAEGFVEVTLRGTPFYNEGILCFDIVAYSDDSVFAGGYYYTERQAIQDVKIALCICTFKREKYIEQNMKLLGKYIFEDEKSELNGHLFVYIADNGNTLNVQNIDSEYVKIFANPNLGGAGGFTRAMIEASEDKEKKGFTHVLLMDDDVLIEPESIFRTYTLATMLKEEYKGAFIGGATMRLDHQNIQYERGARWNGGNIDIPCYCLDVKSLWNVLYNEKDKSMDYIGWWYCCMPIDIVRADNLPLPIFIFRDDIEYALRNCKWLLTLNGIGVWHEPFDKKDSTMMDYYGFRNMAIVNSIHMNGWSKKAYIKFLSKQILKNILTYRYKNANLNLKAAEDFCKGIDWLKEMDATVLNKEIINAGYKYQPIDQLGSFFDYSLYLQSLEFNGKYRTFRRLTLNGYFLKCNGYAIVPAVNPMIEKCYRKETLLNYDPIGNRGFITHRDKQETKRIIKRLRQVIKLLNNNYDRVAKEYATRYCELTTREFWNEYLGIVDIKEKNHV